ncbi:hypothetical protein MUP59_11115, partial [Candidatus Bathyarchaeota archaeon]|nr:hypothetical protein [Candidatus Bathyarchaeota archaeon]
MHLFAKPTRSIIPVSRKGISPVIATVILVAVTITVSVSIAYWMGGISGSYTRIGNRVFIDAFISTEAVTVGSSSGDWFITGLPFTPAVSATFAIL